MSAPQNTFGGALPQTSQVYLGGISNVSTIDAASGAVLMYNAGNGKWESTFNATNSDPDVSGTGALVLTTSDFSRTFINRDPDGGAANITTPTAAALVAANPGKPVGFSISLWVRNEADAAETLTLVGDTGVTVDGDADIGQNNCKLFIFRFDNVTSGAEAITAYSMGTLVYA